MTVPSAFDAFSPRRRSLIILILAGVWTLGAFATDLFLPAMPAAAAALGASESAVALSVTAVLIGLGASSISRFPQGYTQNAVRVPDYQERVAKQRLGTARGILALGVGQRDEREFAPTGEPLGDFQARRSRRAVDEDRLGHGFIAVFCSR